jgi:cytochrome d ubiquinol oxidase subunit I
MFSMAMWMAAIVAPLQIFAGDLHGLNTLHHQPAKVAAMEGHFESGAGMPLILFGLPNPAQGRVDYKVQIPYASSLILTHELNGALKGLDAFPAQDRPPVEILFWSFRIMVGLGFLMAGLGLWSLIERWRGRLHDYRPLHLAAMAMAPSGFIAVLAGWTTTEVGRQPFTVYGLLRTTDSVSPIAAQAVGASLIAFIIVYFLAFSVGVLFMLRLMNQPPHAGESDPPPTPMHASGLMPAPVIGAADGQGDAHV